VEALLLLAVGGFFALLYVLTAAIRTIRHTERIGFLDTLLAFLVTLVLLAALMVNAQSETPLPGVQTGVLAIGLVLLCLSGVIAVGERGRPQRLRQSRGVLGIGTSLLVIISTFTVPLVHSNFEQAAQAGVTTPTSAGGGQQSSPQASDTNTPTRASTTASPTLAPSVTPSLVPTSTGTPTPAPTATRVPATPTPTPTLVDCQLVTDYNVNLRAAPDSDADVLLTIPFNTSVSAFARSEDSTWWQVSYEGQTGWLSDDFVTGESSCLNLPVQ
jgi:hypothetical protein